LYGTEMKHGSSLGPLSVLMKGEVLPAFSRWSGIPTRQLEVATDGKARLAVDTAPTDPQGLRPDRAVFDPGRNRRVHGLNSYSGPAVDNGAVAAHPP
jgi:hypothetical protein